MELANIFFGNFLVFAIIYLAGSLFLFPHKYLVKGSNSYVLLFYKLFFGVVGVITIFSLYHTRFFSINLVFLFSYFILSLIAWFHKGITWKFSVYEYFSDIPKLIYFLPVFIFAIAVGLFKHHYFLPGNFFLENDDVTYYLQMARFMPAAHHESVLPWNVLISQSMEILSGPYHYGDLWLISFCVQICPFLPPMLTYNFVLIPVLIFFTAVGLTCLIYIISPLLFEKISENYFFNLRFLKERKLSPWFIPFLGFLFAMYWGYTPKIPLGFIHTISIESKIFNFIFPVSFAVLCFINGNKVLSFFSLSAVFILDFVYFPIFAACFGFLLIALFLLQNRLWFKYFFIPLGIGIYILFYYFLDGSLFTANVSDKEVNLFTLDYFLGSLSVLWSYLSRHLITSFPFYIALFFLIKNRENVPAELFRVLIFLIVVIMVDFLLTSFGHFHREHWQFSRSLNPATSIFFLVLFSLGINNSHVIPKWIYFILFFIVSIQGLLAVISQSTQSIEPKPGTKFSVLSRNKVQEISGFLGNERFIGYFADKPNHSIGVTYNEYNFSGFLKNNVWFVEINLPAEIPPNTASFQRINLETSPFFDYMKNLKAENSFSDIEKAQLKFLKEQSIKFVLMSENIYPEGIKNLAIDSLYIDTKVPAKLYKLQF